MTRQAKPHQILKLVGLGLMLLGFWQAARAEALHVLLQAPFLAWRGLFLRLSPAFPLGPKAYSFPETVRVRLLADQKILSATIDSDGLLRIDGSAAGRHVSVRLCDKEVLANGSRTELMHAPQLTIWSPSHGVMRIRTAAAVRKTYGPLRLVARRGTLEIVDALNLESYVMGIVGPELGSVRLHPQALKAQLVASRSYVLASHNRHPREDFDFCDLPHCQVFGGIAMQAPTLQRADRESRGEYLSYHGRPAVAFFHHNCGGMTAAYEDVWPGGAVPYLRRVRDGTPTAYCDRRGSRHAWSTTLDIRAVRRALVQAGLWPARWTLDEVQAVDIDPSGRARQIMLLGSKGKWISSRLFVNAVNRHLRREVLLSTAFHVTRQRRMLRFAGRGWGHGVGLCQEGAIQMAREGYSYRQILAHYFPGTEIRKR